MPAQFRLKDSTGTCKWQATADTPEELMVILADHVRKAHKVEAISEILLSSVKQKLRRRPLWRLAVTASTSSSIT